MPRKVISKACAGPKAVKRRRKWKVTRGTIETATLFELKPDNPAWFDDPESTPYAHEPCDGAIVKLTPPPGVAEATVSTFERMFYNHGAASVKVMPIIDEERVTVEDDKPADLADQRSLMQVAIDRAKRVSNSHDPKALVALVKRAMEEAVKDGA